MSGGAAGRTAARLAPFGTTIFAEMTRLAIAHDAVNLSQGFPDFDGPEFVKRAAADAMARGENQYARTFGVPALVSAIGAAWKRDTGVEIDPDSHVTVTSGCTEALAAALLGLVNPGDEVVLFEPYYDSYRACVAMAGASARFVPLRPGADADGRRGFFFDEAELRGAFGPRTRAVMLNTPHNPTGKVFSREELRLIADLAARHDAIVISDEVYERLWYDPARPHVRIATMEGMQGRVVTCSSIGKTFSLTGWKVGWTIAPPELTRGVRAAHQFLTFATATPLQHGAAAALDGGAAGAGGAGGESDAYVTGLVEHYRQMRDYLSGALGRLGLVVYPSDGTYFIMADHSALGLGDDVAFCRALIERAGVAAIPPSAFYENKPLGRNLVRFAYCKKRETMEEAVRRLEGFAR